MCIVRVGSTPDRRSHAMSATKESVGSGVRSQVSFAEWEQRVNLAACYRLAALYHWDDLIFTHISARGPGPEHHFLLNPYGMLFDEITASRLVKVDLACNKLMGSSYSINPCGGVIRLAIRS